MVAVGELETEYAGRAQFNVVSAEDTAEAAADIEAFGFSDAKHGLVVFDSSGEAIVMMPGHQFTKDEIASGIDKVVAAE